MSSANQPPPPEESHPESSPHTIHLAEGEKEINLQQTVQASDSIVQGVSQDFNVTIFNQTYSIKPKWVIALVATAVGIILMAIWGSTSWISAKSAVRQPEKMKAILRVGVAGFAIDGAVENDTLGNDIAQELAINIDRILTQLNYEFSHEVWGPDRIGQIQGDTREKRAASAQEIAAQYNAAIVIYGAIDATSPTWFVTPEFYISGQSFIDALEVTGQYELGAPFVIPGNGDNASRIVLSSELAGRAQPLTELIVGLAFYATRNFERAFQEFKSLEESQTWPDDMGGKQVLYLLLGNTSLRQEDLETAELYYRQSIEADANYSRAYAGLGNLYFLQSLVPVTDSDNLQALDPEMITQSIDAYLKARNASNQPALSDIETKVHFGLGQAYLMQSYADETVMVAPAIPEYEAVIEAYDDGANPRVKELAAEAYVRLGKIYAAGGETDYAIELYEKGIKLIEEVGDLQRRDEFKEDLQTIIDSKEQT